MLSLQKGVCQLKVKKISLLALAIVVLVGVVLMYFRPVGTVEGPEWDVLRVDGVTYLSEKGSGIDIQYDRSDRGRHLGIIKSGEHTFHIYAVKGDPERKYLYWAWDWEGEMFIREALVGAENEKK